MRQLLARLPEAYFTEEFERTPLLTSVISSLKVPSSKYPDVLLAYYGKELLKDHKIRHAIISLLPLDRINALNKEIGEPSYDALYDAAFTFATSKWTASSPSPKLLKSVVHEFFDFEIPQEYFPETNTPQPPSIEEVFAEKVPPLFDYQLEMVNSISAEIAKNHRFMLQMPTGSGKTRTAMTAVLKWLSEQKGKKTIVWLAHSEELCEQAISAARRVWLDIGGGTLKICRLWGKHDLEPSDVPGSLIVAGLPKITALMRRGDDLFKEIASASSTIVFDEAHKALATTYLELVQKLIEVNSNSLIGISATPGRGYNDPIANRKLAKIFDAQLLTVSFPKSNALDGLRGLGVLAKLKRVPLRSSARVTATQKELGEFNRDGDFSSSILDRIGKDAARNIEIVKAIKANVSLKSKCLVFCCGVDHSRLISTMLTLEGIPACAITGDMSFAARAEAINGFRSGKYLVLANFSILTTGFDAPDVGVLVIARPTKSIVLYSQMIGRGLRGPKVGGKEFCTLIDVEDNIKGFGLENEIYTYFSDYWTA